MTDIKPIPTKYNGIQFRSRLEARWAAMFELLDWEYEYEPCDFNGWIPDFLLKIYTPVFVEVKPVQTFPRDTANKIDKSGCLDECLIVGLTIDFSSWEDNPVIGWLRQMEAYDTQEDITVAAVHLNPHLYNEVAVEKYACFELKSAWIGDWRESRRTEPEFVEHEGWDDAVFGRWTGGENSKCSNPNRLGFCHAVQSYIDRVTGCYDGGCFGAGDDVQEEVKRLWKAAGNTVQWRK